jgi:uncharacterized membrane protein
MFELIFIVAVVYLGTYKLIEKRDWKRVIRVALLSFLLAIVLTFIVTPFAIRLVQWLFD